MNYDLCRYCQNIPVGNNLYCSNECENFANVEFIKYTIEHSMRLLRQVASNLEPCIKKLECMEKKG